MDHGATPAGHTPSHTPLDLSSGHHGVHHGGHHGTGAVPGAGYDPQFPPVNQDDPTAGWQTQNRRRSSGTGAVLGLLGVRILFLLAFVIFFVIVAYKILSGWNDTPSLENGLVSGLHPLIWFRN